MQFNTYVPAKVSLKSFRANNRTYVKVGLLVDGVWYNKITAPYSLESSIRAGNPYKLFLGEKERKAKNDFIRKDGTSVKAGDIIREKSFWLDYSNTIVRSI